MANKIAAANVFLYTVVWYNKPNKYKNHTSNPCITWYLQKWKNILWFWDFDTLNIYLFTNEFSFNSNIFWYICFSSSIHYNTQSKAHQIVYMHVITSGAYKMLYSILVWIVGFSSSCIKLISSFNLIVELCDILW